MEQFKILLIENDDAVLKHLSELLEKEKFEVVIAQDGIEGLALFDSENPDIVVTDLRLPGKDGLQIMEAINGKCVGVPIILITGYGDVDIALKAIRLGALDYLKKPIDVDTLLVSLGRATEKVLKNRDVLSFPTVLVADDEDLSRKNLAAVLEKEGWHTLQAENGLVAVEVFKKNKVDIVLLDIKMPKMNGIAALHEMRKISSDFEAIIITGYGDETAAIKALRDGAMNFIRKPIDIEEILILVEKGIEHISTERSLKHRTRELELQRQIVAQISQKIEIAIQVSELAVDGASPTSSTLLDYVSDGIVVADENMNVIYSNKAIKGKHEAEIQTLDEQFCSSASAFTNQPITHSDLMSNMSELLQKPLGTLWRYNSNEDSPVTMIHIRLVMNCSKNQYILLILRPAAVQKK